MWALFLPHGMVTYFLVVQSDPIFCRLTHWVSNKSHPHSWLDMYEFFEFWKLLLLVLPPPWNAGVSWGIFSIVRPFSPALSLLPTLWLLPKKLFCLLFPPLEVPFSFSHSSYCYGVSCQSIKAWQCLSSWPSFPQRKQNVGSLSYLKWIQNFSPSLFTKFSPLRRGLSIGRSTLIRINFAWSDWHARLSTSMKCPKLFPISWATSSNMSLKGKPYSWTLKGEWVKITFAEVRPFFHLQRKIGRASCRERV